MTIVCQYSEISAQIESDSLITMMPPFLLTTLPPLLLADSLAGRDENATGSMTSCELLKLGERNNDWSIPHPSDGVASFLSRIYTILDIISVSLKIQTHSGEVILSKNMYLVILSSPLKRTLRKC